MFILTFIESYYRLLCNIDLLFAAEHWEMIQKNKHQIFKHRYFSIYILSFKKKNRNAFKANYLQASRNCELLNANKIKMFRNVWSTGEIE